MKQHGLVVFVQSPTTATTTQLSSSSSSQASFHPSLTTVATLTLKDYQGLETSEPATLKAVAEFGYHSALGNMDEAFKSIKLIKRCGCCFCIPPGSVYS